MNKIKTKFKALLLAFLLALAPIYLTGCGTEEAVVPEPEFDTPSEELDDEPDDERGRFYGQTLTVTSVFNFHNIREFARAYMEANPGVSIEVNHFQTEPGVAGMTEAFERAQAVVATQLMAGTADTLITSLTVDLYNPEVTQRFADWWPIINADPNFNPDHFNINALNAFTQDGRLYTYPLYVSYILKSVNNTIPGLPQAFAVLDFVTAQDLHNLHNQFSGEHMTVHQNHDVVNAVVLNLNEFLDLENGVVNFNNPRFVDFIEEARDATRLVAGGRPLGASTGANAFTDIQEYENSLLYSFMSHTQSVRQYIMTFEQDLLFGQARPLTNERGEILAIHGTDFALNAAASPIEQELAWDFLRFMQNPANLQGAWMTGVPVYLPGMRARLNGDVVEWRNTFSTQFGWNTVGTADDAVEEVYAFLNMLVAMPHTDSHGIPAAVYDILFEVLEQFHDGLISAQSAAELLQNRMSIVMMEIGAL